MRLRVMLPTRTYFDEPVDKVVAEGTHGLFGLLPRHVDMVSELVPSLLSCSLYGEEQFLAIDVGILVKVGDEVLVATGAAVGGADLQELRTAVEESFHRLEQRESVARTALARLETDIVQRLVEMQERRRD